MMGVRRTLYGMQDNTKMRAYIAFGLAVVSFGIAIFILSYTIF
jgi:hypothetical protein